MKTKSDHGKASVIILILLAGGFVVAMLYRATLTVSTATFHSQLCLDSGRTLRSTMRRATAYDRGTSSTEATSHSQAPLCWKSDRWARRRTLRYRVRPWTRLRKHLELGFN